MFFLFLLFLLFFLGNLVLELLYLGEIVYMGLTRFEEVG